MYDQKVFVLGEADTVLIFGLLGIDGIIIKDNEDFLKNFKDLIKSPDIGMIIIGMMLIEESIDYLLDFKLNNRKPFIFFLPDIFNPNIENDDIILNKINDAIGDIISK